MTNNHPMRADRCAKEKSNGRVHARRFISCIMASAFILSMTACGHDPEDRALSGAGIGAGVGVGAAILGAPLLPALVVGGAVGAVTGAATSDKQIDLGK